MARSKGFKRSKQREMKNLATRGGSVGGITRLTSEASKYVGRPGFKLFGKAIETTHKKASVRRLMVRDPAKGISNEAAAQHIHNTPDAKVDMVDGVQSPEILTSLPLPPSSFGAGKRTIKNRGINRSIKKR